MTMKEKCLLTTTYQRHRKTPCGGRRRVATMAMVVPLNEDPGSPSRASEISKVQDETASLRSALEVSLKKIDMLEARMAAFEESAESSASDRTSGSTPMLRARRTSDAAVALRKGPATTKRAKKANALARRKAESKRALMNENKPLEVSSSSGARYFPDAGEDEDAAGGDAAGDDEEDGGASEGEEEAAAEEDRADDDREKMELLVEVRLEMTCRVRISLLKRWKVTVVRCSSRCSPKCRSSRTLRTSPPRCSRRATARRRASGSGSSRASSASSASSCSRRRRSTRS